MLHLWISFANYLKFIYPFAIAFESNFMSSASIAGRIRISETRAHNAHLMLAIMSLVFFSIFFIWANWTWPRRQVESNFCTLLQLHEEHNGNSQCSPRSLCVWTIHRTSSWLTSWLSREPAKLTATQRESQLAFKKSVTWKLFYSRSLHFFSLSRMWTGPCADSTCNWIWSNWSKAPKRVQTHTHT